MSEMATGRTVMGREESKEGKKREEGTAVGQGEEEVKELGMEGGVIQLQ